MAKKSIKFKDVYLNQELDRLYVLLGSSRLRYFYKSLTEIKTTETLLFNLPINSIIIEGFMVVAEAYAASSVLQVGITNNTTKFLTFDVAATGFITGTQTTSCLEKYEEVTPIMYKITGSPTKGKGRLFILYGEES